MNKECQYCIYSSWSDGKSIECRINPPTSHVIQQGDGFSLSTSIETSFPTVNSKDWCGKFEGKE